MHSFDSIPEDIIRAILAYAIRPATARTASSWTLAHSLTLVCRRWRALALAMLYKNAFIRCEVGFKKGKCVFQRNEAWRTNVNCISALGHGHLVKELVIGIDTYVNLLMVLQQVIGLLNLHSVPEWPQLTAISIDVDFIERSLDDSFINEPVTALSDIALMAEGFFQALPLISSIKTMTRDSGLGTFSNNLIDVYGEKLRRICCDAPLALTMPQFSSQLTHLEITVDIPETHALPLVCTDSLLDLHLLDVPITFNWEHFEDGNALTDTISFDRLVSLQIDFRPCVSYTADDVYNAQAQSSTFKTKLHFPGLRQLRISDCLPYSGILREAVFPSCLESVHISGEPVCVQLFTRYIPSAINEFRAMLYHYSENSFEEVYQLTNHLFGEECVATRSVLELDICTALLDVNQISWVNITDLLLHNMHVSALAELVVRLPALVCINAYGLEFEQDTVTTAESEMQSPNYLAPFNTRLREMSLVHYPPRGTSDPGFIVLACYLATRVTSLEVLALSEEYLPKCRILFRTLGITYPHIQNVLIRDTVQNIW
ncbi:hypothetical protein LPJ66_004404 [Kickxella alabastrina]|uniref:Uncharacterized protein n=1 Tax=Kickxella alabastrina TaxID=61397 RepID=A0ACC1IJR5_9FUNG|nr:hypothetical protein LPJ66_004404 [Kickxella alabastrina]